MNEKSKVIRDPIHGDIQIKDIFIDLLETPQFVAERTFLVVSEERSEYLRLRDQLTAAGLQLDYRVIPDLGDWNKIEAFDHALLVNDILHAITAALTSEPEHS